MPGFGCGDEGPDGKSQSPGPGPAEEIKNDRVTVSVVVFTNWGGFIRRTYTINRASPHTILDVQNETLMEYH